MSFLLNPLQNPIKRHLSTEEDLETKVLMAIIVLIGALVLLGVIFIDLTTQINRSTKLQGLSDDSKQSQFVLHTI